MRGGIYVDADNIMRSGGWNLQYDVLRSCVESLGVTVLRANTYMAYDPEREASDLALEQKKGFYRDQIRRCGFKVLLKEISKFSEPSGEIVFKGDTDLDLAVDALVQSSNLDYVLLVTGDGDFIPLVQALQNKGIRVDVIGALNVSRRLRVAADNFSQALMIPDLIPSQVGRHRGVLSSVNADRFFGHIATLSGYLRYNQNVFCHGKDFDLDQMGPEDLQRIYDRQTVLEFDTFSSDTGLQAKHITIYKSLQS